MRLVLRNHRFQTDEIELAPGTREIAFPGNLSISLDGSIANHCHTYDRPWETVAVFVRPQECPRCPK